MISEAALAHWQQVVPWTDPAQVEQDLVLTRMIIEIARHPELRDELVFRGGTCFHKLWLDRPWRYSEDLDYVRRSATGVGPVFDALREVATNVGFEDVATQVGQHPKVRLRSTLLDGRRLQIKIEMNTFERSPAQSTTTRPLAVENPWFAGEAEVPTFTLDELTATKIRALFQRRKSRDLFDLWLAFEHGGASPTQPSSGTRSSPNDNIEGTLSQSTPSCLIRSWAHGYPAIARTVPDLDIVDAKHALEIACAVTSVASPGLRSGSARARRSDRPARRPRVVAPSWLNAADHSAHKRMTTDDTTTSRPPVRGAAPGGAAS